MICQSGSMFHPHHDLKTLRKKSINAINTVVHSFENKASTENPGVEEIGRFLLKGSIMVYRTLFV